MNFHIEEIDLFSHPLYGSIILIFNKEGEQPK